MTHRRCDFVKARRMYIVVEDCTEWNENLPANVASLLESKEPRTSLVYDTEKLCSIIDDNSGEKGRTFIKVKKHSPFSATLIEIVGNTDDYEEEDDCDESLLEDEQVREYECFNWKGSWVYQFIGSNDRTDSNGVNWAKTWKVFVFGW